MSGLKVVCPSDLTALEISLISFPEASSLSRIHNEIYPYRPITTKRFVANVHRLIDGDGRAWILRCNRAAVGFGSITPTPGLFGLLELNGFIAPARQRQGLATYLLRTMLGDLAGSDARQLYYPLASAGSPAAHFLAAFGFHLEHEECHLTLDAPNKLPQARFEEGFTLRTRSQSHAISCFRRLYQVVFTGLPWYQPYESELEVAADLADAQDLLFLDHDRQPIGFLWLRWSELDTAEIEPIGLLPSYQRRGLGRQLMLAGINQAVQQGARKVIVGVWSQNVAAVRLYQRLGFRETGRKLFMAYDLAL